MEESEGARSSVALWRGLEGGTRGRRALVAKGPARTTAVQVFVGVSATHSILGVFRFIFYYFFSVWFLSLAFTCDYSIFHDEFT